MYLQKLICLKNTLKVFWLVLGLIFTYSQKCLCFNLKTHIRNWYSDTFNPFHQIRPSLLKSVSIFPIIFRDFLHRIRPCFRVDQVQVWQSGVPGDETGTKSRAFKTFSGRDTSTTSDRFAVTNRTLYDLREIIRPVESCWQPRERVRVSDDHNQTSEHQRSFKN